MMLLGTFRRYFSDSEKRSAVKGASLAVKYLWALLIRRLRC